MSDYVELHIRSIRGWPWPDDSCGLSSMYGEGGWCVACGTPLTPQRGPLTLLTKGMQRVTGAWLPNWRFDAVCLDAALTAQVAERFSVRLWPIAWRGKGLAGAAQIVPTVSHADWFDPDELREIATRRHGTPGAACPACGLWRWMPLPSSDLPLLRPAALLEGHEVIASPEWFGAGCRSFHELRFRRPLAELIAAASPRALEVREVRVAGEPERSSGPAPRRPARLPAPSAPPVAASASASQGPELVQWADLGPEEFARHPVWVNCHTFDYDEAWYEETDEDTFRPWDGALPVDPAEGIVLVRASLLLADGSQWSGFLTPAPKEEQPETLFPQLFAGAGAAFSFWGGMPGIDPREHEWLYATLGKSPEEVFPIRAAADEGLSLGVTATVIEGFSRRVGDEIEVSW